MAHFGFCADHLVFYVLLSCPCACLQGMWVSRSIAPIILNFCVRWKCVVRFIPNHFTPRVSVVDIHWIGSWMSPKAILDALVKIKVSYSCWKLNHSSLA